MIGEGAAILILERLENAEKRGATIFGEIRGYGLSSDASHFANPSGSGALNCMKNALENAKVTTNDIGYINAHATSSVRFVYDHDLYTNLYFVSQFQNTHW